MTKKREQCPNTLLNLHPTPRPGLLLAMLSTLSVALPSTADTPAFDRPGIGFSVTTLPVRTFAWEQGLPDMTRERSGGVTETLYSADALFRAGLTDNLELQISHAPYNYLRAGGRDQVQEIEGASGTGISLKYALPDLDKSLSWAVLGGSTIDTGDSPFSPEDTTHTLGTTLEWELRNGNSGSLYFNIDRTDGESAFTVSPAYNVTINECTGAYLELGYINFEEREEILGGGGITWMANDIVQLDIYADFGLNSDSTDVEAGLGFSVFID